MDKGDMRERERGGRGNERVSVLNKNIGSVPLNKDNA